MRNTINIRPIPMKSSDQRGQVHHFTTHRSGEYMLFYRNKGAVTAQHYHKGLSQQKNPEQFLLLQGTATLHWRDLRSDAAGKIVLQSPVEVDIYPWIWHEVVADTDFVMLELNATAEGPADTFYLEKE